MKTHAKKILIIDDEPDVLEFLSYNFRKHGYEVETAGDGIIGFNKIEENLPHVILTDILMPNLNGIALCHLVRATERYRDIPVIFFSATKDISQMENAISAGGDHFFAKPVRIPELIECAGELVRVKNISEQLQYL